MSDVSKTLDYAATRAKNKADETMESVRSGAAKAVDQASDVVRSRGAQAMEAMDQVRDASSSLSDALKSSIERQPLSAISLAAAAGFLFATVFFRRR